MYQELHQSVLLNESVAALVINKSGCYLDSTFGRGGHSRAILNQLNNEGRLYVIDCDPEALVFAEALAKEDDRVTVLVGKFESVIVDLLSQGKQFDGVFFDFGVSSPQLDDPQRGFSFQHNGPLDMRMNNQTGMSAADWINQANVNDMKTIFWQYGDEKNAARIAKAITIAREDKRIETTRDLVEVILKVNKPHPKEKKHPATRVFQAIRIFINDELGQIERTLPKALKLLKAGGRLVVISFHSLEDRIVKRFMRSMSKPESIGRRLPVVPDYLRPAVIKVVGKPTKACDIDTNVRARSAVMRVAEVL